MVDLLILFSAGISFVLFLLLHIIIFRFISTNEVLDWVVRVFAVGVICDLIAIVFGAVQMDLALGQMMVVFMLSFLIYGLLSFLYVVYIFGTSESSIRLRLIHEISKMEKSGISLEELMVRYNTEILMKRRFDRLVYTKHLVHDGQRYHMGQRYNFFLFIGDMSRKFRKIITSKGGGND